MFNIFAPILLEKLHGKKLPVMLAEEQGKTERTWRNRMNSGWEPTPEECEEVRNQAAKVFREKLISHDWSDQEATEIIARNPAWKDGAGRPTANLIFLTAPDFKSGYEEAMSVAIGFDRLCHAIAVAFQTKDLASVTQSLLAASNWLKSYFPEDEGLSYLDELECKIRQAADLAEMQKYANKLGGDMFGHVISCWDLNFCSSYFDGMLQAFPMFALVMPRPAPNIEIEPGTGRLHRNGKPPKSGIYERPISRLLDFTAVLYQWRSTKKPPKQIPSVNEMVIWFKDTESRIVSWRDETTKFRYNHFRAIFDTAFNHSPPTPMLAAALMWSPAITRKNGKIQSCKIFYDDYEVWWKRNLTRLTDKGLKFGEIPLPSCLSNQLPGSRSPES